MGNFLHVRQGDELRVRQGGTGFTVISDAPWHRCNITRNDEIVSVNASTGWLGGGSTTEFIIQFGKISLIIMLNLTKKAVVICLSAPAKVAAWYPCCRSAELSVEALYFGQLKLKIYCLLIFSLDFSSQSQHYAHSFCFCARTAAEYLSVSLTDRYHMDVRLRGVTITLLLLLNSFLSGLNAFPEKWAKCLNMKYGKVQKQQERTARVFISMGGSERN